ncbi:hypothetical protein MNBD_IGNAVI01-1445 [hydrothermal vent metagenome]|uniref:Uncharacterized protein n=1 Tax=hydrothermal vent metagenome TaxID=652676 RepID=A0A3B1BPQ6_9ZZZZ
MLLMLIFIVQNQAQEFNGTSIKDSIFTSFKSDFGLKNLFNDFGGNNSFGQSYFDEFRYNRIFTQPYSNFELPQFDHFDKCLNEGLKYGLKDQHKYDLGVVGEYLGLTKNAAAILIGILSLL